MVAKLKAARAEAEPRVRRMGLQSEIRSVGWWLLVLSLCGQLLSFGSLLAAGSELATASFWMFAPPALVGLAMWLTGVIEDRLIQIACMDPRTAAGAAVRPQAA
jgi:hypothetical protein